MDSLRNWKARRSGNSITIESGWKKLPHVTIIQPRNGKIIATTKEGRDIELDIG